MAPDHLVDLTRATRARWNARYQDGEQPWDTRQTPPEVVAFWHGQRLTRDCRALDLGCGPGTNVRYLARLGLEAIGVEIASLALATARRRLLLEERGLSPRVHFLIADVCRLPFQAINASYVLDVGCFHSLPDEARPYYVDGVVANIAPRGYYHLYGFDRIHGDGATSGPGGLDEGEVAERFAPHLAMVEEIIAQPDRRPCRWYLLQRTL